MRNNGAHEEPVEVIRNLTVAWSDRDGDYVYTLDTLHEYKNGERIIFNTFSGNESWAMKVSKHYNLIVPKAK